MQKSNPERILTKINQVHPLLVWKLTLSGVFVWIISRMKGARKKDKLLLDGILLNGRKVSLKLACKLVDTYTDSSMCYYLDPLIKL